MPVARRYQGRQVATAALPGVRQTASETDLSTGAGLEHAKAGTAGALAGFGHTVQVIATSTLATMVEQERKRADEVALLAAGNQIDTWENEQLYGDGTDAKPGALSRMGKDALGLPEELADSWSTYTSRIEAGLTNDRQKAAFAAMKAQRGQNIDGIVRRHVFGEMQTYEQTELKATVANGVNNAISNALDPRRVGEELARVEAALKLHAPRLGVGAEGIKEQIANVRTATHAGVIERLLVLDNPKAAEIYFQETRSQIAGDKIAAIEKAIEEGSLRKNAQLETDKILKAGGGLADQREAARQIANPKLRDAVMERVEHEDVIRQRLQREADEKRLRDAYSVVDRTKDVAKISPLVWSELDGSQRSALRGYAENLAKAIPVKTDIAKYYGLMRQAADDPQVFAMRNLLEFKGSLDEVEFKQLSNLQLQLRNGETKKAAVELDGFRTNSQIVNDTLALYKMDPTPKAGTDEAKANAQLMRIVDQRVQALQSATGKKANNKDVQAIVDDVMRSNYEPAVDPWGPFGDHPARMFPTTIGDIPAAEAAEISSALRRAGRQVDDAAVIAL